MEERSYTEEETLSVMEGMEEVNRAMGELIAANAPRCHMRPMFLDCSDSSDGFYETWWECSVCGHTKSL